MHTEISDASRLVETARREPFGISFTWLTIFDAVARAPVSTREHIGQRLARAFHAGRHDAGGDHRRFQQAQIIAREIENFGQCGDLRRRLQIDAGQAQHRLVDHAQPGFDRRLRRAVAPRTLRSIETLSTRAPSGKSMPRKKMSLQPL